MEFGQLIEYNVRNNFPEKLYTKCGGEALPRPFFNKSKIEHISSLKFVQFVFIVSPSKGLSKYIETKLQTTWYTFFGIHIFIYSFFKKRGLELVSLLYFPHDI